MIIQSDFSPLRSFAAAMWISPSSPSSEGSSICCSSFESDESLQQCDEDEVGQRPSETSVSQPLAEVRSPCRKPLLTMVRSYV